MGGRRAPECSHTKAPCLSKGSGCFAVSGPWAEVETEAIRLGFHGRLSCMGVSNERPGWMRRVRSVSSSPAAWPSPQRLVHYRDASAELWECRRAGLYGRVEQWVDWGTLGMGWGEMGHRRDGVTWGCGGSFCKQSFQNRSFHYLSISQENGFFLNQLKPDERLKCGVWKRELWNSPLLLQQNDQGY